MVADGLSSGKTQQTSVNVHEHTFCVVINSVAGKLITRHEWL